MLVLINGGNAYTLDKSGSVLLTAPVMKFNVIPAMDSLDHEDWSEVDWDRISQREEMELEQIEHALAYARTMLDIARTQGG